MTPRCWCGASSRLTDATEIPQTKDQFDRNVDNYVCANGHVFEAPVPIREKNGYAIRADM